MYPEYIVSPMREEMRLAGFKELMTADEVKDIIEVNNSVLVFVNSICGCVGIKARSLIINSIKNNSVIPSKLTTVFAGMELDAVEKVRSYAINYPPSSPSILLFKNKKLVYFISREIIENNSDDYINNLLKDTYQKFCL